MWIVKIVNSQTANSDGHLYKNKDKREKRRNETTNSSVLVMFQFYLKRDIPETWLFMNTTTDLDGKASIPVTAPDLTNSSWFVFSFLNKVSSHSAFLTISETVFSISLPNHLLSLSFLTH